MDKVDAYSEEPEKKLDADLFDLRGPIEGVADDA